MQSIPPGFQKIVEMTHQLTQARIDFWLANDLFSWQWWFILMLLVVPWVIFYFAADRKKLPRLMLYGSLLFLFILILDLYGYESGLWTYPHKILPFASFVAFVDGSPLPVVYMLEYQFFPNWRSFVAVIVLTSAIFSFVMEPIFRVMELYILIKWKFFYSFPVYIAIPLLMRLSVEKVFAASKK